jgi:flagellar protein FliT
MNSSEIITIYEAILTTTGQMLKCRRLTKKILINDKTNMLSSELRQRKLEIIQQVLADDAEIRTLTQPWAAQLQNILSNTVYKRKLTQTPDSTIIAT